MKKLLIISFLFIFYSSFSYSDIVKWTCTSDKGTYNSLKYINWILDFEEKTLTSYWKFEDQQMNTLPSVWKIIYIDKEKIQVDDGWLFYYGTDQRTTWSGEVFYHKCELFE